jgi:hypothetical protein
MKERQQSDFSFVWFLSQGLEFTGFGTEHDIHNKEGRF